MGKYCLIKKKLESALFTIWKRYIQDSLLKKQNHCFFHRPPRIFRITNFYTCNMGEQMQIKGEQTGKMILHFKNAMYRMPFEKVVLLWRYIENVHNKWLLLMQIG